MTKETKMEVIIGVVLAAFFVLLWWMNRANGGGTGLGGIFPELGSTNGTPLFNVSPTTTPDGSVSFGAPVFNIGGSTIDMSNPGACNCGPSTSWLNAGSANDMAAWLASLPNYLQTAQNGLTNWN